MAKKQTTAIANYDEELARMAGKATALTSSGGGGRFFSTRAGVMAFDDTPLPGNQMVAIIGAWCLENVYYEDAFDADNRTPPTCFAFCKDPDAKDEMAPHENVDSEDIFTRQADQCEGCPQNSWGSAARGRGKACSNRRRLALLSAGTFKSVGRGGFDMELINDPDHFAATEEAYLKVPVTSGKAFDAYVREVADQLQRPLFAVYTRIYLTPDPKTQFKVNFELIEPVEPELIPVLMDRYKKLDANIDFPYTPFQDDGEQDAAPARTASSAKKLTGKAKAPARKK